MAITCNVKTPYSFEELPVIIFYHISFLIAYGALFSSKYIFLYHCTCSLNN